MEEFRLVNDLPQRPKFYLHRSRRFWGGLAILLFGVVWLMISLTRREKVYYSNAFQPTVNPATGQSIPVDQQEIIEFQSYLFEQRDGGIYFELLHEKHPKGIGIEWKTGVQFERQREWGQFGILPRFDNADSSRNRGIAGYLPIFPLVVLWAIFWPLWIRRGDKLDEKRFLKPPQPLDP